MDANTKAKNYETEIKIDTEISWVSQKSHSVSFEPYKTPKKNLDISGLI